MGAGRGSDPSDDEAHWCGVGLTVEGSVNGLGHIGGAVHPVGYGCPVRLWYGLDEIAQLGVLSDGDGEADIHLATDGNDGVGIEAAVGPHRERSRSGVAHSRHRLPQEVGCAPGGVGPALAQIVPSARLRFLRQRPAAGDSPAGRCSCAGALPPLPVRRSRRPSSLCRSSEASPRGLPRRPRRAPATPGSPGPAVAHVGPAETAQEGPQRGWSLDHTTQYRGGPARTQHVGVVYAVAASQSGCHQGQYLVPGVGPPRGVAQVNVVVDVVGSDPDARPG